MLNRLHTLIVLCVLAAAFLAVHTAPASASTLLPRRALLRSINHARAAHHLAPVHGSAQLHNAAKRHSHDMMLRRYFAHTSPLGSTVYTRIVASGFVSGFSWLGGETLAWGTGALAAPGAVVNGWLASPEHRAIMLSPTYRWIGISRTCGTFEGHRGACVWTADWVKRW
jgi:uncharacterized protein YkwD